MIVYHDSDWVDCKDCLWHELEGCKSEDEACNGCYNGEKMEEDE